MLEEAGFIRLYILQADRSVKKVRDMQRWAEWMSTTDRTVAWDATAYHLISTVFLGLDHNFKAKGPPLLFETMVQTPEDIVVIQRCSTWDEAELQHKRIAASVLKTEKG